MWFLGNLPSLAEFSKIFSTVLDRPSSLLSHYAGSLPTPVPTTLDEWRQVQKLEPEFLTLLDPDSLANCNGLTVFKSPDFPSRILVPPSLRDVLITQHHHDLQHVSHPKVLTSLARHIFWPAMKTDVRRVVEDCEICENEKGKRNLAHGLFSSNTTTKPRSRYSMDFQGQGLASTGETEALALIDSFTKTAILISLTDRHTTTLLPRLMDALHFSRGSPDLIHHSDDAPELLSDLMTAVSAITAQHAPPPVTTTPNPTGKLSHGGGIGTEQCAISPRCSISTGLFTHNASSSHTTLCLTSPLAASLLSKWISPIPLSLRSVRRTPTSQTWKTLPTWNWPLCHLKRSSKLI